VLDMWIAAKQLANAIHHAVIDCCVVAKVERFEPNVSFRVRNYVEEIIQVIRL